MSRWRVPLADLDLGRAESRAALGVMRSRWLTMGPQTEAFEKAFAEAHRAPHAVAVSSGTAALHLAYVAAGLTAGSEVILPALTFVATVNAAVACGALPVFADVISATEPSLDPDHVATLVTPRTRAIVAVHYGGYPCRIQALSRLASARGLALIEDCAHSPGIAVGGRFLGTWGKAGCFSFFSNKNITTGEGGMVTTRDARLARRIALLRSHGMSSGTWKRHHERPQGYDVLEPGWNYRIDEIRSAIGRVQLRKLERNNRRRRKLTARYRSLLADVEDVQMAFPGAGGVTAAHLAPLLVANGGIRGRLVRALTQAGVQTSHHFPPAHLFSHYRQAFGCRPGQLPRTEDFAAREISLPLHAGLPDADVDYICRVIRNAMRRPSRHARRVSGDS